MIKCEVLPGHIISHKNRNYKVGEIIELENTEAKRLESCGCIEILQSQENDTQSQNSDVQLQNDDTQSQEKVSASKRGKGKGKNEN